MGEIAGSHDADVGRLLTTYYEGVEMNDAFRLALQIRTRRLVGGRTRIHARRWVLVAAAGVAGVVVAGLLLRHPAVPPTPQPPRMTSRPAPAVAPRQQTASAKAPTGGAAVRSTGKAAAPPRAVTPQPGAAVAKRLPEPLVVVIAARQPDKDETGRALAVGDRLPAGAAVKTGKRARLTLITRRGSEYTLNAGTELVLKSRDTAALRRGEIYCRSRAGEIKLVDTTAGKIHLLGTVIDAAAHDSHQVAVTVVSGKVRLSNAHGEAVVPAGKRSVMVATAPPTAGVPANTFAATAWYDGRGAVLSEFGDIAYAVGRGEGLMTEVWAMNADGTNKRRVKSYLGFSADTGPWLPGQQWLLVNTHSALWTTPDFQARRAHAGAGHPIVEGAAWLLDAATGQDIPFQLPPGYDPRYMEISPDATRLAFCGSYRPDRQNRKTAQGGVWVYDLQTGEMKKVLDGWIKTPVAWAPDSRRLAASTGEGYGANYPLVVVDADTGEITDLKVQGGGPRFSPDGTKLAYCGDFKKSGSWHQGVLTSGSIFVLDLGPGGEPRRISPEGEGALEPRWSPDGTRVAYWVQNAKWVPDEGPYYPGYRIFVAQADGSGAKEIYHKDPVDERGGLRAVSWSPDGASLYVSTVDGVLLVAADGSGVKDNLGGNEADSVLPPAERTQTTAAVEAVQEAIFQFAVGKVRSFEGRADDARTAFQTSADIFAGLPWRCPLADFSTSDVLRYADKAAELAQRPRDTVLVESCKERMSYAGILLTNCAADQGRFPSDLASLEQWSLSNGWGINWLSNRDTEWVKMIFRCPEGQPFTYAAPPAGEEPQVGDVLLTCVRHPDCRFVWDEQQAQHLAWRQEGAARQAREKDPELKALYRTAEMARADAEFGVATWQAAEDAHLAVLRKNPKDVEARTYLGRMYASWGRYREALETLPANPEVLGGWAGLNRAFCFDALGQRSQAVALYQQLLKSDRSNTINAWAKLGMAQPTWPRDLEVGPESGEVRLMPGPAWQALASGSRSPGRPEFAVDDNRYTRWAVAGTAGGQNPGTWFQLDLGAPQVVSRIVIDHLGVGNFVIGAWARGLEATVTSDGNTWEKVECAPAGPTQPATVRLNPARPVRTIRLTVTTPSSPEWWSIYEIYVFGPAR